MQHAVVTGGKGALGQAIARELEDFRWTVASPGRLELDVTDPAAVSAFFRNRPVDLLVCNAGITRDILLARSGIEDWNDVLNVNYHGAALCAAAALPGMLARKNGHIVFISSHSALHPPLGQAAYAASKAALLGLTKDLACRHGSDGIRVNAILPGFLETPMTAKLSGKHRGAARNAHSLGRFNTVREVAGFIRFLHENLPHTSGQIFQLDSRC
ncbi:MAG: SDR family NAD(P)-dependent oxidoreductase [Luteolibacter sp.]